MLQAKFQAACKQVLTRPETN